MHGAKAATLGCSGELGRMKVKPQSVTDGLVQSAAEAQRLVGRAETLAVKLSLAPGADARATALSPSSDHSIPCLLSLTYEAVERCHKAFDEIEASLF